MWLAEDLEDTPFKWKNEYKIFGFFLPAINATVFNSL